MNLLPLFLLLCGALILRAWSSLSRQTPSKFIHSVSTSSFSFAIWMAAGAGGAWFPWWPAVLVAAGAMTLARLHGHPLLWIGADCLFLLMAGIASNISVNVPVYGGTTLLYLAIAFWLDRFLADKRLPNQLAYGMIAGVSCGLLAISIVLSQPSQFDHVGSIGKTLIRTRLFYLAISPLHLGEPIRITERSAGWYLPSDDSQERKGALLFHGNDPEGSMQPATFVLAHGLQAAGFTVIAVDHPGYGLSPVPSVDGRVEAWDPQPLREAALTRLAAEAGVDMLVSVGHSMGTNDLISVMSAGKAAAQGGIIFGGSWEPPAADLATTALESEWDEDSYIRFHRKRSMNERLSKQEYLEINRRYYASNPESLPLDHGLLLSVHFAYEWNNIVDARMALFDAIPGQKDVMIFENTTHYLNAASRQGIVFGDVRTVNHVAELASSFAEELNKQ